jgi:hypothetical protein
MLVVEQVMFCMFFDIITVFAVFFDAVPKRIPYVLLSS